MALAAIAGAGIYIAGQIPRVWPPAGPPAAQPGPAPGPALVPLQDSQFGRSRIVISKSGVGDKGVATRPVVAVSRGILPSRESWMVQQGILIHEIFHQAFLGEARELGATVRDGSIGEEPPVIPDGPAMEILSYFPRASAFPKGGAPSKVALVRIKEGGREILWGHDLTADDIVTAVEQIEDLVSRELPPVLEQLGVLRAAVAAVDDAPLPEDVQERLARMTFTEQFAAVRAVNQSIRDRGESPERLGAKIRGYAHLGVLTEYHWDTSSKAYAARALLAAERWVRRSSRSADSLRHRAYARALAGLHKAALDDLVASKDLPGSGPGPEWVPLIEALCRFDTKALVAAGSGRQGQLAMLLAFLTVEVSHSKARAIAMGRALLAANPECYRVHDALCRLGGISTLHRDTLASLATFSREAPRRLRALPGLPERSKALVDAHGGEAEVVRTLIAEGGAADAGEPSWAALGWMIREARFANVWQRAYFLRFQWSVPVEDFLAETRDLVADHPYRTLLESFGVSDLNRYRAMVRSISIPQVEEKEYNYISMVLGFDPERGKELSLAAWEHGDRTFHDLAYFVQQVHGSPVAEASWGHIFEKISPYAPTARAALIRADWPYAGPHAAAWEAESSEHPEVLLALGQRAIEEKRWPDAERLLSQSLPLSPDRSAYEWLAHAYKEQGKLDRWKATLDHFLENEEDFGLDHATVRVEIANHFMALGRWAEAQPYAEAAAASWAAHAMDCARNCYEGMQDWEHAELWARRTSERYPEQCWARWFGFCKRTGHGDAKAATAFVERYLSSIGNRPDIAPPDSLGFFFWLSGSPAKARDAFGKAFEAAAGTSNAFAYGLNMAILHDEMGDTKRCREVLDNLCANHREKDPETVRACELVRDTLGRGGEAALDLTAMGRVVERIPPESRGIVEAFVGLYLRKHGKPEDAKSYLMRCAKSESLDDWAQIVVLDALHELEGNSGPVGAEK